ncbi:MAG TPA: metallopeptidase TldD-related protein [Acidobacteriota bacterium]|nr:metallopeptidase TldD-related protein [Acidobacteriota bacterium]
MRRDEAKAVLDALLEIGGSRDVEAILGGGEHHLTRFANNEITQNVSERRHELSVRVLQGKRSGRATGNDLSRAGLERLLRLAEEAARVAPESPDALPLPEPQTYREVAAVDEATARFGPADRAREVACALEKTRAAGLEGAGIYETGHGTIGDYGQIAPLAMANSRGLFAYHDETSAVFSISALRGTESGWAERTGGSVAEIDAAALAAVAVGKAVGSHDPRTWEPGSYDVILEPAAVGDLLFEMNDTSFGALALHEGRSFLAGKLGTQLLGEGITIHADPYHPLHQAAPFDGEGMPTRRVTIVERGVARSPVYDRRTAAKDRTESTGHGLPYPNTWGPFARDLVLEGGDATLEELISGVERGLLVTRVWYTNVVDPKSVTVTGMTRDGLFAIEGGRVTGAVRNFRFNESVVEMFRRVDGMTPVQRAGDVVCPALRVRGFTMSSVTEF